MTRRGEQKLTPALLFAFYEQELQATIDQLKEYPKPHLLPAIMEMIQARRNHKAIADHVRRGIRGGINTFVNSAMREAEGVRLRKSK